MRCAYKNKRVVIMAVLKEANTQKVPKVDIGAIADEDMEEGEAHPPLVSIVERFVTYQGFAPNHAYCNSPEHVTEDYPNLLKEWEEKKTHYNMVHTKPHKNKKDEEVDVRVITRGKAKTGRDFEQTESSSQKPEGKIKNATQHPPKFDATQLKQFLRDV